MGFAAFSVSFVMSLIFTPLIIKISYKKNLLDHAIKGHSIHTRPIPFTGGIVLYVVFFIACLIFKSEFDLVPFFLASLIIFVSGLCDDLWELSAIQKLFFQFVSASILVGFGVVITRLGPPFLGFYELGIFSIPVTLFWFVFVINLVNLIDVLEGLAAGLCAMIFFILAVFLPPCSVSIPLLILLGSVLAFLFFNFHPAKIFLGNLGSSFLGFSVAYFSLVGSQKTTVTPILLMPCVVLFFHIMDIVYVISRRNRQGVSIFKGDRKHFHHLLLRTIRNHSRSVLLFYLGALVITIIFLNITQMTRPAH